ncbi:MAG: MotA/TolQ/ExbB proton channel family protein [Bacteroidales bacterium]|jgi:biopolymer transport protein ExbB|nr:MotA/TolQ/ExbB proton channel family protein [Bacteroidales bacterium]
MKKLIALFTVIGLLTFGISNMAFAQNNDKAAETKTQTTTEKVEKNDKAQEVATEAPVAAPEEKAQLENDPDEIVQESLHYVLKNKFIEGGAMWMAPVLVCLILGLALVIERIFYLNLATVNSAKLLEKIEDAIKTGGISKAKELCRDTKGPLAGVFYQGLDRYDEGMDSVEKAVVSYGGVQMSKLEVNLSWIALFLALGPMLGFLGTVVGMVFAFDDIERAGDISPTIVAGGMKVALLTTVFGLITAIILQIFYNYILSKIDSIVSDMEDATISFMDILIKNK